jgi:hypothetical protein
LHINYFMMRKLLFIFAALVSFATVTSKPLASNKKNYAAIIDKDTPSVAIAYLGSPFCASSPSPVPVITGAGDYLGGTFTASPIGLLLNNVTGEIDLAASAPGTYMVTYTTPTGPEGYASASFVVTLGTIMPTFNAIAPICSGSSSPLLPTTSNNGITGTWTPATIDNMNTTTYTFTPNPNQCAALTTMTITVIEVAEPIITSNTGSNTVCVQWDTMESMNAFVLSSGITNPNYTFEWYKDGVYLVGQSNPEIVITAMYPNQSVYSVVITSPLGCSGTSDFEIMRSGPASLVGSGSVITNLSGVQSITVTCAGYGIYKYSIDGGGLQNSPVFDNVPLGTHVIVITDANSCGSTSMSVEIVESAVDAPLGSANQDFGANATLADITVAGTNVQWYASATDNETGTSTQFPLTVSLPLSTLLVDGTTYYATQIVNGVESVARLAVTVHVTLSVGTHESFSLAYSPNPVTNSLSLKAKNTIDTITVTNLLGQVLKTTAYNQSEVIEDMGGYTTGTYFVKVVSGDKVKVIKILKD